VIDQEMFTAFGEMGDKIRSRRITGKIEARQRFLGECYRTGSIHVLNDVNLKKGYRLHPAMNRELRFFGQIALMITPLAASLGNFDIKSF
jgi:hypothetical protein